MRQILFGLAVVLTGCAIRTGNGALSASTVQLTEGFVPRSRLQESACNFDIFFIPLKKPTTVDMLAQRMSNGADGLIDLVVETQNYSTGLVNAQCIELNATPIRTGQNAE